MIRQPQSLTDLSMIGVVNIYTTYYKRINQSCSGECLNCLSYLQTRNIYIYHNIRECFEDLARYRNKIKNRSVPFLTRTGVPSMKIMLDNWTITEILHELMKDWRVNPYLYDAMKHIFPHNIMKVCKGHIMSMTNVIVVPWYNYDGLKYYHNLFIEHHRTFLKTERKNPKTLRKPRITRKDLIDLIDTMIIREKVWILYSMSSTIMRM